MDIVNQVNSDYITKVAFPIKITPIELRMMLPQWIDVSTIYRPPTFHCLRCHTAIVTPPWFEDYITTKFNGSTTYDYSEEGDPRVWLSKHVNCCDNPRIWYLVTDWGDMHISSETSSMYPRFISEVWILSEDYIKSHIIIDEFL